MKSVPALNQEARAEDCTWSDWAGKTAGFCDAKSSGRRKEKAGLIDECEDSKMPLFSRFLAMEWINRDAVPEESKSISCHLSLGDFFVLISV